MPNKASKKNAHIMLFDGCYCSQFKVFPEDWNETGADPSIQWRIWYRFYDPAYKNNPKYKKGLLRVVKGMNSFSTLTEKRKYTIDLLKLEEEMIIGQGYNPITKLFMAPAAEEEAEFIISPETPFADALDQVYKRLTGASSTMSDLRSVKKGVIASAAQLRLHNLPVNKIKRRHIIMILDNLKQTNSNFSDKRYKKYRAYLLMMFNELVVIETLDYNPIEKIPIPKVLKTEKELLTTNERKLVHDHLRETHYPFYLFTMIFYHSGSRETEILKVKGKDVDLVNQRYKVTILKGKQYREEYRVIKNVALNYWQQAMVNCGPNDYVFSEGLKPGPNSIRPDQITRRWKRHVKDKLGITKDFYWLKALNSDETDTLHGLAVAAAQNSHKNEKVTMDHYAVGHKERMKEILKNVNNTFVPED